MTTITFPQVTEYFLPKVAREYDIIDESNSSRHRINYALFESIPSIITTNLLSHNRVHIYNCKEGDQADKEGERVSQKKTTPPNYLALGLFANITAVASAFGLGRLKSSIASAKDNIWHGQFIMANFSVYNQCNGGDKIYNIARIFHHAEVGREEKLSHYQNSLMGMTLGVGTYIIGFLVSIEILPVAGIVIIIASGVFGTYHAAIHWDDFTKTQNELKNLKLLELIRQYNSGSNTIPQSSPPPPGWKIPPW